MPSGGARMIANSKRFGAGRVVGFIDLGTNSVRLLVVRVFPNGTYTTLGRDKESVRLGEGEFRDNRLQPEAMQRASLVLGRFVQTARSLGAHELHAVATAATREASNRDQFLKRVRQHANLELKVISGKEEARLIYLGVSNGIKLGRRTGLFIDIGGGSTEVIVGNHKSYAYLDTMRLGAIRLTSKFFKRGEDGPVSDRKYAAIQRHVRSTAVRVLQRLKQLPSDVAIASSGTAESLAQVASLRFRGRAFGADDTLPAAWLGRAAAYLRSLPLRERRKVAGLNPQRADIIVSGAAILETLVQDLGIEELRTSERGLQDGLLLDYLHRQEHHEPFKELSVREQSVLRLGRLCGFDEPHARHVARLALELFDSARDTGLLEYGDEERELLEYAALLHDAGMILSHTNHQAHSYYFIKNADLLGFDQDEVSVIATVALYHRKPAPQRSHPEFASLDRATQKKVRELGALLRLAESLDRSHAGLVRSAVLRADGRKAVVLELAGERDAMLEIWGVQSQTKAFRKVFARDLTVTGTTGAHAAPKPVAAER